jgi:hypothetical protein
MTWALAACLAAGPARADVLYTNLGPGQSYSRNFGYGESGPASFPGTVRQAFDFTVSTDTLFDSARLAVGLSAGANEIDMRLYNTVGGQPGAVLETIHVSNQMPPYAMYGSGHLVEFDSTLHPLLQAGGTYWLLPLASGDTEASWNMNDQGGNGPDALSTQVEPTSWRVFPNLNQGALEVNGTPSPAPEPSGLALAGVGAAGLLGFLWRRRRKPARRMDASWTSAVACGVCPGISRASRAAASFRRSP